MLNFNNRSLAPAMALALFVTGCASPPATPVASTSTPPVSDSSPETRSAEARLDNPADTLFFSKQFAAATALYQKTLEQHRIALGNEAPGLVTDYYNLATVAEVQKHYVDALKYYRQALHIAQKEPTQTPIPANALNGYIAVLFAARGQLGVSKNSALQSAAIYKNLAKGRHPFYAVVLYQLAEYYWHENDWQRAEDYFHLAINTVEQQMGRYHPYLAVVLDSYVAFMRTRNDDDAGLKTVIEKAAEIRKKNPKKQLAELYRGSD